MRLWWWFLDTYVWQLNENARVWLHVMRICQSVMNPTFAVGFFYLVGTTVSPNVDFRDLTPPTMRAYSMVCQCPCPACMEIHFPIYAGEGTTGDPVAGKHACYFKHNIPTQTPGLAITWLTLDIHFEYPPIRTRNDAPPPWLREGARNWCGSLFYGHTLT